MSDLGSIDYLTCPTCDVEIPLDGDERVGQQIYCPYCQVPLKIKKTKTDEIYLQEDF
ncbi:MAG TPA: lysine biosynthesis protein LysW [Deltaproteobacteria bacterium]|nr:lysine biosynthesis protein LysW [Deltaproteobacteria bacterium]